MSIGSQVHALIAARVADENDPLHDLVTGVVEKRALVRPPSPGKTVDAFDANLRTLISIVVRDRGENEDSLGPSDSKLKFSAIAAFPQLYIYGPTTASGRANVESVYTELQKSLLSAAVIGEGGTGAGVRIIGHSGIDDDPELMATIVDVVRLQADGFWQALPITPIADDGLEPVTLGIRQSVIATIIIGDAP